MNLENWVITLSIAVVALAFVAGVIFMILVLISLKKTLQTTNELTADLKEKVDTFDPIFRVVSHLNEAIERKTDQLSREVDHVERELKSHERPTRLNTALEIAEWSLIGLSMWKKIKERR